MTSNTEFLVVVQDLLEKADRAESLMKALALHPSVVPDAQVEFAKVESILKLQSHLIRKLAEERAELNDLSEEFYAKYPQFKQ